MKTPRTLRAWLVLVALSVCCVPFMACKITVVDSTTDLVCGDGVCDADEDGDSCAADCAVAPEALCGDGACDEGEGLTTCAEDCVPEVGYDVTRAPVGVSGLLSQDVINEMLDTGMNLYEGNAPPSVVGRYELNSLEVLFDGWLERANTDTNIMSYELDISEEGGVLMACQYQADSGGSECSVSAYLTGSGVCFTLVNDYAGRADACEYDRTEVISGCVDESGNIADYQSAFFMTNHDGDCAGIRPAQALKILVEDDSLAEAIND